MNEGNALQVGQLVPKTGAYELDSGKTYILVIPDNVTNREAIALTESLGNHSIRATIICSDKVRIFESVPVVPILHTLAPVPVEKTSEAPAKVKDVASVTHKLHTKRPSKKSKTVVE